MRDDELKIKVLQFGGYIGELIFACHSS